MEHAAVPTIFVQTYLEVVTAHGFAVKPVLQRAGLSEREVHTEPAIGIQRYEALIQAVRETVGDIGIGMEMGWRLPPTAFGSLGMAILSSATLGDALSLCQRFWGLYGMGLCLSILEEADTTALEFEVMPDVALHLRATVLEAAITSLHRCALSLLPPSRPPGDIWFDFPAPAYADKVRACLGTVCYDMPSTRLRFPSALLTQRLPMANAVSLRIAVATCEREALLQSHVPTRIASRVQQALAHNKQGYPSLEQLAQRLHLSPRTLRRRLEAEGIRYLDLLQRTRIRDAKALLLKPGVEIQQIAQILGYADAANFTRAFRQRTGQTPSAYRAQHASARSHLPLT